jgi:integrase
MSRKSPRAAVALPKGVHRVVSRGREYIYFQAGRGTTFPGPRIRLPTDTQSPEFWVELRKAHGIANEIVVPTFNFVCDLYDGWLTNTKKSDETKRQYRAWMKIARMAWGTLPAEGVRPHHVVALMDTMAARPGMANNVLTLLRGLSQWGVLRKHFPQPLTAGVKPYSSAGGHKPWTPAQIAAAENGLTGMVRRAFFLARYTGQRGSDVVRLGETFIDDGGFRIVQKKTGREVWCPIDDALATEIATWERAPGPYLRQNHGKLYTRKLLDSQFSDQREEIAELKSVTFHGLRATRVVELRQLGLTTSQIQDQVGMALNTIERYCRFADKKANGKASVISLQERRKNGGL